MSPALHIFFLSSSVLSPSFSFSLNSYPEGEDEKLETRLSKGQKVRREATRGPKRKKLRERERVKRVSKETLFDFPHRLLMLN